MSKYMLLLYAADGDEAERDRRWAEMPEWDEVTQSMREAAVLSNAALSSVDSATTVRVRHGEMELTDGPFAVTKEILAGYYLVECPTSTMRCGWWLACRWPGTARWRYGR